jgi:hypothetical protein
MKPLASGDAVFGRSVGGAEILVPIARAEQLSEEHVEIGLPLGRPALDCESGPPGGSGVVSEGGGAKGH